MFSARLIIIGGLFVLAQISFAAEFKLQSGNKQTMMIELYTSEGCNSCPPAEAFLNNYASNPDLWRKIVPLAFHVDYWDYLGWKDPFAKPDYSQRQRLYGRVLKARTIYTPEFFVNGREWRRGFFRTQPEDDAAQVGNLSVTVSADRLDASFSPVSGEYKQLDLNIAVLGMDLESDIQAGENEGRKARHQFVVLAHKHVNSGDQSWETRLPRIDNTTPRTKRALVVWVSHPRSPIPIQATGGFFPDDTKAKAATILGQPIHSHL
jgi:hypothetical protein